jgi:hypothetical protein
MTDIAPRPPAPTSAAHNPEAPKPKADQPAAHDAKAWFKRHWKWLTLVAVLVVGGGGVYAWTLRPQPKPQAVTVNHVTPKPTPTPTPLKKASPLTGVMLDPDAADRPVVSVVIENHPDARPQSGLQAAGVVYEANAEGGITRFQAFYLDTLPASLGPVRSLRTYFVDWGLEFNAPVAHAGGNADALDLVGPLGMKDLNALSFAQNGFFRVTNRFAPHNLYTTGDKLTALLGQYGFNKPANFTPSPRQPDHPNANPPHPNVHIDYSYNGYQVDYKYDPTTNDYARSLAGAPHIDAVTGKQIHVKNVVVEMMPTSYGTTRAGEQTVIMQTVGQGQGWVLRDGDAIPVTWRKDSHTTRTQLLDASGKDVPLDAGNTWYSIVPQGKTVSF